MIVLGIDSSTDILAVGLANERGVIAETMVDSAREHASKIVGLVDSLISEAKISREEIEGIAVAIGPGSFTGLRVGLAVAKGMARALGIPIIGVSTFEVLADRLRDRFPECVLIGKARKGEYYLCRLASDIDIMSHFELVREDDLPDKIGQRPYGFIEADHGGAGLSGNELPSEMLAISGGHLARLGALKFADGYQDELSDIEPFYVAPSQAERKFGRT